MNLEDRSPGRLPLDPSAAPPHLAAAIHDALKGAILGGQFRPSERINQEEIARELGVSRTPVREALHSLAREGLVELQPRRGAFVCAFGVREISEIYEVRGLLEPDAAAAACLRAIPAQVALVRRLADEIERATSSDMERAFTLNREFHQRLCEPCDNRLLMTLLEVVWSQHAALSIFAFQQQSAEAMRRTYAQHREIVDTFAARDADRAREIVHQHIAEAHRITIELIAESHLPPAPA